MRNDVSPKITVIACGSAGDADATFNNTITITSSSTEGQFSSDGANWSTSNDSSITFVSGVGNFYYKDTNIGTPTITVSRTGLVSDIQQETITENPNAIKLAIVTPSRNINAGDISDSICVQAWTINNIKASSYNGTCTFSTTSGAGRFCVTQTGETWTSSIILNMITGETYVYYKDTRAGSPVITVTSGTLENTSQVQSVSPLSFNNTSSYITFTPYTIKADGTSLCTAVVTICDTYGNPLPGKTVSLSTPRGTKDEITKLLPEDGVTNTNGQCSFTISSSYSGQDTITAVVSGYPGNTISRGVNKEGAVGIWHFDDGNSITLDASGYNNTGTLTNGPVYLSGKYGKALQFDGVDDYIDCGNNQSLNCTSQITIEAWVKRVDPDHNDYILCKNNAYMFEFQESGSTYYFRFRVYDGGWKFAWSNNINSISQTEWNHYAVRFKRPNVYFYVNGKPWGTPTLDNTPALSSDSVTIGALKTASTIYSSKGSIDEVKLYNRLLTSEEIKASYDARANVYFTSYKLNFTPSPFKAKAGTSIPLMVTFGGAAGVDNSFNDTALLESSSDSGQFSANGSSWNGTNTMIVKLVSGETQVYYKDLKLGTPTLTVSRGSEYESSSQIETITAGRIEFISPQFTIHSNETVSIRIIASDYAGNTDTNWSETVQFSSNSSRCKFSATDGDYNDTTIVLRMVQGETSCYLKNTRGGIWTITAKSYDYTWTIDKDTPVTGAQANTITQPIISVTKYHQKKNITYNTSSIPVTTGETISYKLSITNLGSETATNLIITDTYVFDTSVNNAISLNDWDTTSWFSSGDSYTYTIDPQGIDWQPWGSEPPSLPANNIKGLRWKINLLGIYEENKTKNIYFEIKK